MIISTNFMGNDIPLEKINIVLDDRKINRFLKDLKEHHPDILDHPEIDFENFEFAEINPIKEMLRVLDFNIDPKYHVNFSGGEQKIIQLLLGIKKMRPYQTMILTYPEENLHTDIIRILIYIINQLLPKNCQLVIVTANKKFIPDGPAYLFKPVEYNLINLKD